VPPGATKRWDIQMTAPETPGLYKTDWMLKHWSDEFGPYMFIDVTVVSAPDTTPPTGRITLPSAAWATNSCPITIQAEASDSQSGVDFVEFHVLYNGSWHHLGNDSTSPYSWSWPCTSVSDQTVTLTIHVRDKAGNEVMDPGGYVQVLIDRVSPTGSISSPAPDFYVNSDAVTINVEANDDRSGVGAVEFPLYYDGSWHWICPGDTDGGNGWSSNCDLSAISDRTGLGLGFIVWDRAGNWTSGANWGTLDRTPPTSSVGSLPEFQHSTLFGVYWYGYDATSGVASFDVQYKDGSGGLWTDWLVGTSQDSSTFAGGQDQHTYYFRSRATDNAGNVEVYPGGDGDGHTTIDLPVGAGPLVFDSYQVNDADNQMIDGNGDGVVNCGEKVELYITLRNEGTDTAYYATSFLSSTDPYITWEFSYDLFYGDIPAGGKETNMTDAPYRPDNLFQVDPVVPSGHAIHFDLAAEAVYGGPWHDSFEVPVVCGPTQDRRASLPLVVMGGASELEGGIYGRVTERGNPVSGVPLDLRLFNGSSYSTVASTTTGADGRYLFAGVASLGSGQRYYVQYANWRDTYTPGRLWSWNTWSIRSYTAGSIVDGGDFDIADIALVFPADGATVSLPQMFYWTPRPATPADDYEFDLFDGDWWWTDPLGYAGDYTLNSLPSGFEPGTQYWWQVCVYGEDGYGWSYEARSLIFSNTGVGAALSAVPARRAPLEEIEDLPPRRPAVALETDVGPFSPPGPHPNPPAQSPSPQTGTETPTEVVPLTRQLLPTPVTTSTITPTPTAATIPTATPAPGHTPTHTGTPTPAPTATAREALTPTREANGTRD